MEDAQQVGQQAHERDATEDEIKLGAAREVGALVGGRDRDPGDAEHDRRHRDVLVAARALAEHPLSGEHQHEQAGGERGLNDDQGREFERDHLQRPAEHRERRAEQPAFAPQQSRRERESQVCLCGRLLGVHRLEGDPYAVEDRGTDRREQPKDEIAHDRR